MKQFKSKKVRKKTKITKIIFVFFFIFSYVFMVFYLSKNKTDKSIIDRDINYLKFNLINYLSDKTDKIVNNPVNLLNSDVKKASKIPNKKEIVNNVKEDVIKNEPVSVVEDENKKEFNPVIYIYNTHETEKYVDFSVMDASYYITNKLNEYNINAIYEEQSVAAFLQANSMKYYKSYSVSRKYLDETKNKYPSIKYFFDIHRDALSKEKSTITIDNKNYAKIMFIIGTDNPNYEENYNNAIKLNEIINGKMPGISRGVIKKGGEGVNGRYNQDFSSNLFLIEVGGNNNNKEEVINTLNIIIDAIKEYTGGFV